MSKEKELEALKAIDGEFRFKIDLKRLSDNTFYSLLDCFLFDGLKANEELLEAIAKDNDFNSFEYKEHYRNVNMFQYIKGRKKTPLTDLELDTKIKEYELTRRA